MPQHVVNKGECLASIAEDHGFADWQTIYGHSQNAGFRSKRPDPNVIHPGDRLYVPDKRNRQESRSTEQRHRFRKHRAAIALRLILLDEEGKPCADRRYRLEVEEEQFEGRTDSSGLIDQSISPKASSGRLTVWLPPRQGSQDAEPLRVDYVDQDDREGPATSSGGQAAQQSSQAPGQSSASEESDAQRPVQEEAFDWDLAIGYLDPVEVVTGIQARLFNLGFNPGPIDDILGPATREAARRFQKSHDLVVDGVPGPKTQAKLKELHGC